MQLFKITLVLIFSAYLFLFGLGQMALTDPDEPFYAQTSKEMLKRGEWLTPRIFGKPQFEKPPLYYWFIIVSYKIFGVNEFAARFPSALFGILGILGIYFLGKILFSRKTGLYASLIMATAIEYMILARACVTDMVLAVSILYAFLFYLYAYLNRDRKIFYLFASGFLGLAVLTKGPVGVILPISIILLYLLYKKDIRAVFRFPIISGGAVFFLIAIPWYFLMHKVYGASFIDHFFGFQNITRFLQPEHKIGDVFYYYIPIMLGGFFPWSIFLPYGIHYIIRRDKERFSNHAFLFIWILVFFIFFSLARTKLPTYIFPIFPALAIIIARFWELNLTTDSFGKGEGISGGLYILSLPAIIIGFYIVALKKYPDMTPALLKTGIVLSLGVAMSLFSLFKKNKRLFFHSIVGTMALCIIPLTYFLSKPIGLYESSKYVAYELKKHLKGGERIGAETDYQRGIAFYIDKEDVIDIHKHHIMTKFLDSDQRVWGVIKDKNHWQLYTDDKRPFWEPTYVVYQFGKKVVITNKIPEDGKYLKVRSIDDPI